LSSFSWLSFSPFPPELRDKTEFSTLKVENGKFFPPIGYRYQLDGEFHKNRNIKASRVVFAPVDCCLLSP
jgi:hypothetical protein